MSFRLCCRRSLCWITRFFSKLRRQTGHRSFLSKHRQAKGAEGGALSRKNKGKALGSSKLHWLVTKHGVTLLSIADFKLTLSVLISVLKCFLLERASSLLQTVTQQLTSESCSEAEILEMTVESKLLGANLYRQQGHAALRYAILLNVTSKCV